LLALDISFAMLVLLEIEAGRDARNVVADITRASSNMAEMFRKTVKDIIQVNPAVQRQP
jgi:hypothetical protein